MGLFLLSKKILKKLIKSVDKIFQKVYNIDVRLRNKRNEETTMKFNKTEIMKQAWSLFNNETWLCDLEHVFVIGEYRKATFSECLKEAWGIEKAFVANKEADKAYAATSEEKKAWDWACKKIGVTFEISDEMKVRLVLDMDKECWPGTSVWSKAMRAVKLHMAVEKQSA